MSMRMIAPCDSRLAVEGLTVRRGGRTILDALDCEWRSGQLSAICGPNGAGKSTLLEVLAGSLAPGRGQVRLDGRPLAQWPAPGLARRRAVLMQQALLQFPFLVAEVVALGRSPHHGMSGAASDERIIGEAMRLVGIEDLADRDYLALSGGERQRVHIARSLAQVWEAPSSGARWLLLDEPTASLDLRHQIGLMKTLARLAREGWAVVAVLHDLHLVARWTDRCLLLSEGRLVADGPAGRVLSPDRIGEVYGLEPEDRQAFAAELDRDRGGPSAEMPANEKAGN
ncbi:MAG: heme ABC transporter ATP-binding protein [Burkholderiaceae bacterium]